MAFVASFYEQLLLMVFWIYILCALAAANEDMQCLNETSQGKIKSYKNSMGVDGLVICLKDDGVYRWKSMDGSPTIGEKFDPARDCSDIVENRPEAKDGFYWIAVGKDKPRKAWCDVYTDGGGFMLVGHQNNSNLWTIPSSSTPVDPHGPAQFSSLFGKFDVQDFAVQVSTSQSFKETKAYWFYRLNSKRELGNLFGIGNGFCAKLHSGIGNISYVKDVLTDTVVTTTFKCSKFGLHISDALGWARMNYCLKNDCPTGYAFLNGIPIQLDSFGSFSYSVVSPISGVTHSSTAFVGCESGKCCACYGPKGGRNNYCANTCIAVNGGNVTQQAFVWFWIRTRTPKRVWKRCMEFKKKRDDGKLETYFVDERAGTTHMGSCSNNYGTLLNEGTLTVKDKESFKKIPSIPGLLTYRKDNKKLYVNEGPQWEALSSEKSVLDLVDKLRRRIEYLENKMPSGDQIEKKFDYLENQLLPGCKNSRALGMESGAIPNNMLAGSSSLGAYTYGTRFARLNGGRGWVTRYNNLNQYLVVDFGWNTIVTGISSQGRHDAEQYVTGYTISVNYKPKTGGRGYYNYKVGGLIKVFHGNSDKDSIVQNLIVPSFVARAIRIHPTGWYRSIAMRIEVYGCRA